MNLRLSRNVFFGLAYGCILGAGLVSTLSAHQSKQHAQVALARSEFQAAVNQSKSILTSLIEEISADPLIRQNVDWGLNNSVSKRLQTQLSLGELDSIQLAGADCTILASAKAGRSEFQDCGSIGQDEGFRWYSMAGEPRLAFSRLIQLDGSSHLLLTGQVALNESWRSRYPTLASQWRQMKLSFRPWNPIRPSPVPFLIEGPTKDGEMIASLSALAQPFDEILGKFRILPPDSSRFSIALLGGALLALLAVRTVLALDDRRRRKKLLSIATRTGVSWPRSKPTDKRSHKISIEDLVAALERSQAAAREIHEADLVALKQSNRILNEEKSQLEEEVAGLQARISQLNLVDSMGQQLTRSSDFIVESAAVIQETTQDLHAILTAGLEGTGNFLNQFMQQWKQGVQSKGARKFLRGLSETEGERPERTLLDEQLDAIFSASQSLADQAMAARIHANRIIEKTASLYELASRWKSLADAGKGLTNESTTLSALASGVGVLLQADSAVKGWSVSPPRGGAATEGLLAIPSGLFVSALYHAVLAAYFASGQEANGEVVLHYRKKELTHLVVLSIPGKNRDNLNFKSAAAREQFAIIHKLLGPYGIRCEDIPLANGQVPVTFRWNEARIMSPMITDIAITASAQSMS